MLRQQADRIAELEKHCLDEITKRVYAERSTEVVEELLSNRIAELEKELTNVQPYCFVNFFDEYLITYPNYDEFEYSPNDWIPLYANPQKEWAWKEYLDKIIISQQEEIKKLRNTFNPPKLTEEERQTERIIGMIIDKEDIKGSSENGQ
jgi:hypothetical protein